MKHINQVECILPVLHNENNHDDLDSSAFQWLLLQYTQFYGEYETSNNIPDLLENLTSNYFERKEHFIETHTGRKHGGSFLYKDELYSSYTKWAKSTYNETVCDEKADKLLQREIFL